MSRILGIDPGTKRCGLAITDSVRTMAFPRPALAANESLLSVLSQLVADELVNLVVVGRPVALSGATTQSTALADEFFNSVRRALPDVEVIQWDERLTTLEAQRSLRSAGMKAKQHREHVDSAAAVIMLQNYVDGLNVL
jgi:putative Holliday junction resolvase